MGTVTLIAFGAVIGSIFTGIVFRFFLVGTLRVDRSDPDGPFMFLELKKSIEHVTSKEYVVLKIEDKDFIPHK